jgi:hypothetical protein
MPGLKSTLIRESCQRSDLQANPNLADNQYVKRVFGVMPKNEMGEVTFDVFVRTAGVPALVLLLLSALDIPLLRACGTHKRANALATGS